MFFIYCCAFVLREDDTNLKIMKKKIDKIDTLPDFISWLKTEHGYKESKENYEYPYVYKSLLRKQVESEAVCELNDSLSINIRVTVIADLYDSNGKDIEDYQIGITAEKRSKWWKLNCASLTRDEIMKDLKDIEQNLVRLFNNV